MPLVSEELFSDALAEPDADALALDSEDALAEAVADALAEAVADADALADALWLSAGALMLVGLHAARPRVAARLRDRTAIDFFTVFSFLVGSELRWASGVSVRVGLVERALFPASSLAPHPGGTLQARRNAPHASRSDAHGACGSS